MPTGVGQVALLPAAGADARRPDARRLAAGVADAGPGRGARRGSLPGASALINAQRGAAANARGAGRARAAASCGCCTSRPSGSRSPRFVEAIRRASTSGCSSSTRRTASRSGATTSGPTTSRSPTPRRERRRARDDRADRDRDAARRRRHRAAARAARPGAGDDRLRPAQSELRGRPVRAAASTRSGGWRRRWREPDALPAIVYAGTRDA